MRPLPSPRPVCCRESLRTTKYACAPKLRADPWSIARRCLCCDLDTNRDVLAGKCSVGKTFLRESTGFWLLWRSESQLVFHIIEVDDYFCPVVRFLHH